MDHFSEYTFSVNSSPFDSEKEELWEKIEKRQKKKKIILLSLTLFIFFILSSLPVVEKRMPHWKARSIIRQLAQTIQHIKKDALIHKKAFRLVLTPDLHFQIFSLLHCQEQIGVLVNQGNFLIDYPANEKFFFLTPSQGDLLGIPDLTLEFCYHPEKGWGNSTFSSDFQGIAVLSETDWQKKIIDRLSVLLIQGNYADLSFD